MVVLLNLMQLTLVPNIIYHHIEGQRISIYKYAIVFSLKSVAARKHSCKCTAFHLTEGRSTDTRVFFAAYVKLSYIFEWLYV